MEQSGHHVGPKRGKAVSPSQTSALPTEEEGAAFPKSPEGGKQRRVKGAGSQGRQHVLRCPSLAVTGHGGAGEQRCHWMCVVQVKGSAWLFGEGIAHWPLLPSQSKKEQNWGPPCAFWRRQWHPTPVLLPGKSHGRRSLVGCSP